MDLISNSENSEGDGKQKESVLSHEDTSDK